MILLNLKTNNTAKQQFEKVIEEFEELRDKLNESILNAHNNRNDEFFVTDTREMIAEAHDLVQATNQLILILTNEKGYRETYKTHLKKLQGRVNEGKIKVNEYIEL